MADWDDVLDRVVRERGPALARYAYLLTGDAREAEDLVQDALVKTFGRGRAMRETAAAESYVRRAILTTFLDGYRRRRRWAGVRHLLARGEQHEGPEGATSDRVDVQAALGTLSPRERACLVLRFYDDLTVPQIAARLDVSDGAVKRYLSDGARRMEAVLAPSPDPARADVDVTHDDLPLTQPRRTP